MRKRILFAILLATTSLLVACGSTSTKDHQDSIEEVQESNEVIEEPIEDIQEPIAMEVQEYISWDERNTTFYKPYFNRIGYVYGFIEDSLDDDLLFEAFEEYSTRPLPSGEEKLLVNYTNANGTKGAIRFDNKYEVKNWTFENNLVIQDNVLFYFPNGYEQRFEEFAMGVFELSSLSSGNILVKDCVDDENLQKSISNFQLRGENYRYTPNDDIEYILDIEDNYAKLIYRTDYDFVFSRDGGANHIYPCTSYTCIYDDYENDKRYIIIYGIQNGSGANVLDFMNSIEFLDKEHLYAQNSFYWKFPEGMEGGTQKSPYENGMSRNITSYVTTNNHEMMFHWYGPNDLASQAGASNGILTLEDSEEFYKLNAQAIHKNEIVDMNDIGSYGLMEHEHCVEGDGGLQVDDYGTQLLYPIVDDNGYKGYATLLYGSDYAMPQDYVYFFTYVEREDIYDDERALDVMASLDYHLGLEPNANANVSTNTSATTNISTDANTIEISRIGEDNSYELDEQDTILVKNMLDWYFEMGTWNVDGNMDVSYDIIISYNNASYSYDLESGTIYDELSKQYSTLSGSEREFFNVICGKYIE